MRLVCFDLDGTIVDSRAAIVGCFQHALATHRQPAVSDAAIAANIGLPLARMLTGLADPARMPAILATYSADFAEWDRRLTLPFDGMIDAIRAVRAAGAKTLVTSSKSLRGVRRVVEEQGLSDLFDDLLGGDSVEQGKPHPEMLERAMALAGVGPEATAIVGDTTFDIEMGVAAGVRAIGVAWGMHGVDRLKRVGAHAVAAVPADLPSLLDPC